MLKPHQSLRVQLLGRFHVVVNQQPIEPSAWRLRSAAAIVKLLALQPGYRLHREELMDAIWPDAEPDAAANNLRYSLHAARRILAAPATTTPFLQRDGNLLVLDPEDRIWTDAGAFETAVAEAWGSSDPLVWQQAAGLYGGDLLPEDQYEDWASNRRTALRASYLALLTRLAEMHEQQGNLGLAIRVLERLTASDPIHESAHVHLMRLHARNGDTPRALAQFDVLQAILERELDAAPEPATFELMRSIRDRSLPGATVTIPTTSGPAQRPAVSSLPAPLNELLGREREVGELRQTLATTRLLTLTGAGGIGKTRLAIAVAREVGDAFADGVDFVSLAEVRDAALVVSAIADALGVREFGGQPLLDLVRAHLRDKHLLLVLDNVEHLLPAGPMLAELLASCPRLTMLATSRARLRLTGEQEYPVAPLAHPDSTRQTSPAAFVRYPAIALFLQRAREVQPDLRLTAENAATIAEICRRLDGLPLAIELAAPRCKVLPLDVLLDRLDRPLAVLTGGPRDAPERQRTMRNTIRWSYDLLDRDEARLLHRLSVFAGGWSLEAAEAVTSNETDSGSDVLDGLASLVDKNFVIHDDDRRRYRMLEPVREFGLERLDAGADAGGAREQHARYFACLAGPVAADLAGREPRAALDRIESEHDNFRAALQWCVASGRADIGQQLAGALWEFWNVRGHFSEGRRWLDLVLQFDGETESAARAEALRGAGELARRQGDFGVAARYLSESLALYHRLGQERGYARALNGLGILAAMQGDLEQARGNFEEALAIAERLGDLHCMGQGLLNHGNCLAQQGHSQQARQQMEASVELQRRLGNRIGVALALTNLSVRAYDDGEYERARAWTEESLGLFQEIGENLRASHLIGNLGQWALVEGDVALARQRFEESLALSRALGDRPQVASRVRLLGEVAVASGDYPRAARLFGAAEAMRESANWNAIARGSRELYEQALATLQSALDAAEFTAGWEAGRQMSVDAAIDYALAGATPARDSYRGGASESTADCRFDQSSYSVPISAAPNAPGKLPTS